MRPGVVLLVSCRAGDGGRLLPATHARILTGGLVTCDWPRPVTWEAWLVAPPITVEAHTTGSYFGCSGWVMCTWITCANRRSVDVLLLTWSHVLLIILCCLCDLCFCLLRTCRTVPDCVPVLPSRLDHSIRDFQRDCSRICTFTVYISCSAMASGEDQTASDRSGITFQCEIRTSWNPPEIYVDLNSPGVVPDVLGLHAFNEEAALIRVLPGAS